MPNSKSNFFSFTKDSFISFLLENNFSKFRYQQIFDFVYRKKVLDFSLMTNISKQDRIRLDELLCFEQLQLVKQNESTDGTIKYLFKLKDSSYLESVLMKNNYGYSVCVSSQVGCNMGCVFCSSGLNKKTRDLTLDEMILQIYQIENLCGKKISHCVIMGIGEPFDNYNTVIDFITTINNSFCFDIGSRHITVSTSGLIPKILEFSELDLQVNLAVSLHAAFHDVRLKLMNVEKAYPIEKLNEAIAYYLKKTNRKITLEYIMIHGVNDRIIDALELVRLYHGWLVTINLIPLNESSFYQETRSSEYDIRQFSEILNNNGISCIVRRTQGGDINAACGQLVSKYKENKI